MVVVFFQSVLLKQTRQNISQSYEHLCLCGSIVVMHYVPMRLACYSLIESVNWRKEISTGQVHSLTHQTFASFSSNGYLISL